MIEITINIKAQELVEAIKSLAVSLKTGVGVTNTQPVKKAETTKPESGTKGETKAETATEPEKQAATSSNNTDPEIKLEDVRTKLATLSQSGKQVQVRALIAKFDAAKLTDIPKEKYAELMKEAEAI